MREPVPHYIQFPGIVRVRIVYLGSVDEECQVHLSLVPAQLLFRAGNIFLVRYLLCPDVEIEEPHRVDRPFGNHHRVLISRFPVIHQIHEDVATALVIRVVQIQRVYIGYHLVAVHPFALLVVRVQRVLREVELHHAFQRDGIFLSRHHCRTE